MRDESLRKKIGYYEIEHIGDPCQLSISVNLKEYIEKFESDKINKTHKGLEKGSRSIDVQNFGNRINSVKDIENFGKLPNENITQHRFT